MLIWVIAGSALSLIAMKMELKNSTILTFLLLFLLATPCFSRGLKFCLHDLYSKLISMAIFN